AAHSDCTLCPFARAPTTPSDCYCIGCSTTIMPEVECNTNQLAWETHCTSDLWPAGDSCPRPRCAPGLAPICRDGQCANTCDAAICPQLRCPVEDQIVPFGQCCPVCSGESACTDDGECTFCRDFS